MFRELTDLVIWITPIGFRKFTLQCWSRKIFLLNYVRIEGIIIGRYKNLGVIMLVSLKN